MDTPVIATPNAKSQVPAHMDKQTGPVHGAKRSTTPAPTAGAATFKAASHLASGELVVKPPVVCPTLELETRPQPKIEGTCAHPVGSPQRTR